MTDTEELDLAIVGAGPCGLSGGVAARQGGLRAAVFDTGCITRSITLYPTHATFFSTAERLELGDIPFIVPGYKPTRIDALKYYRRVAQEFELDLRQYEEVLDMDATRGSFLIRTRTMAGDDRSYAARDVIIATGYAGSPLMLDVPGEELTKVRHYYTEAHEYFDQDCVVIGAGNSAVEAALDLYRADARVTLVHFLDRLDRGVKPWVLPDITNRLEKEEIAVRWTTRVVEITPHSVRLRHERTGEESELPNDFVLAMTGYRPDLGLLRGLGVSIDPVTGIPTHDSATMETDVRGVFIAGVVAGGSRPDRVFIEDGRHHGPLAVRSILAREGRTPAQRISLGVPPTERPVDLEADGIRSAEELAASRSEAR